MTRVRAMKTRRRRSRPRRPRPRDVAAGRATRLALSLRYARARRSWLPRSLAARLSSAGRSTTNHVRTTRKTPLHFSPMYVPRISRESAAQQIKLAPLSALVRQHNNCTAGCAGGCSHHRTQQLNCFISEPDTHVRIALYHSTRLMTTRPPRLPPRLSISQLLVLLHTRSRSICTYAPDPPCTFP